MTKRTRGRRILVRGIVQGVGFRPWVHRLAGARGLGGRVRNDASGVTIEVFGEEPDLDGFLDDLRREPPAGAEIVGLRWESLPAETSDGFVIAPSEETGDAELSIPPDRATCAACLEEVADPRDRRSGYAFTNCTRCGPRYTIATGAPYDRRATTMARFAMCAGCRREYEDPSDRRFHAEPNACPSCGPTLSLQDAAGAPRGSGDPVAGAARALRDGRIVAVKGLGGFHLSCDATSQAAVSRLRARKDRDEKPFAVMVRDLAAAEALAELGPEERALLAAAERPIVLARRRGGAPVAEAVAPGLPLLGLLLPYTPLHHLLLAALDRPLVMTSANRADEPLVFRDDETVARLSPLADLFLTHDREIAAPCDDSVARVIAGSPTLLRRGRGFVPKAVRVARPFARPVLACGGDLKSAVCIGVGDRAWLGPHIGDLGTIASLEALEDCVEHLCELLRVRPELVAHDLHPEFLSTRFALAWPASERKGVQHHHAHVASALGEHGLEGPVLALAWDGTGHGGDGTSWGGELLLADALACTRIATFRPLRLAGGDAAIRQVWRAALVLLDDAFDGEAPLGALGLFRRVSEREIAVVRQLVAGRTHAPPAHGVGRLFDAVGAILLARPEARFEGQVALLCGELATAEAAAPWPFGIDRSEEPWTVDLRPALRALVSDHLAGRPAGLLAARFHETLVAAGAELVEAASARFGTLPVALTGGCFQNPRLAGGLQRALSGRRNVYLHREVPPGDGGLALGQALVADARSRACA